VNGLHASVGTCRVGPTTTKRFLFIGPFAQSATICSKLLIIELLFKQAGTMPTTEAGGPIEIFEIGKFSV
jgi:hypothetical protein